MTDVLNPTPATLDELMQNLVTLKGWGDAVQFSIGDEIGRWIGRLPIPKGEAKAFWGMVASQLDCSSTHARDLYRVAHIFPVESRTHDRRWSWYRECSRFPVPMAARSEFAEMSVREIQDFRRSKKISVGDLAKQRVSITLMPQHLEDLATQGKTVLMVAIPVNMPGGYGKVRVAVTLEVRPE